MTSSVTSNKQQHFAFVFGMASGHINPSLPVARALVELGHEVHYLCREQMREAIEDTGAKFHSDIELQHELYATREAGFVGAVESMKTEYGLERDSMIESTFKLQTLGVELMLPGTLRWLRAIAATAVLYCPMMNTEAALAAEVAGIPSVALMTTAGPGSIERAIAEFLAMCNTTADELCAAAAGFEPHVQCLRRLKDQYGLDVPLCSGMSPVGRLEILDRSVCTLVTTSEDLQDIMTPELAAAYEGTVFEAVGPLLDGEGAHRAGGHRSNVSEGANATVKAVGGGDTKVMLAELRAARASGRPTILLSMGTVITGDDPHLGWSGRLRDESGDPKGLSGKELCQSAWASAFDVFGSASAEEGPLIVAALGPQPDALDGLEPPANAICLPVIPQVDVLRLGIDLFVTHGGQNSFTEALAAGTPVVVCPGFGDQAENGRKAEALGVGLQVPRPAPPQGEELAAAAAKYRADVAAAVRQVFGSPRLREAAAGCQRRLAAAGGVPRAVEIMLRAAETGSYAPPPPKIVEEDAPRAAVATSVIGGA